MADAEVDTGDTIQQLYSMGFELELCLEATKRYGNDITQATNWILMNPNGAVVQQPKPPPQNVAPPQKEDQKQPEEPINIDENLVKTEFLVHKAVWMLDLDSLKQFAKVPSLLNTVDLRGQTPLSLALLLERDEVAQRLLELGADPRTILGDGWSILELLCAQCKARDNLRHSIMNLYIHKLIHRTQEYERQQPDTLAYLRNMPDFYLEINWDIQSWIPLVSSYAPSDTFKIWKKGSSIRFDSFVRGFSGTNVVKGHLSYIVTDREILLVDHERRTAEDALIKFKNPDGTNLDHAVRRLTRTEEGRSALRTNNVSVSNKKNLLGYQKSEKIGEYDCNLAVCSGIKYSIIDAVKETVPVDMPDFCDYFDPSRKDIDIKFLPNIKVNDHNVNVDLWLTNDYPVSIQDVGVVLRTISPASEDIQRLADIFSMDFPQGTFPVKLVIPIMMSVYASVSFSHFEETSVPDEQFQIPREYHRLDGVNFG